MAKKQSKQEASSSPGLSLYLIVTAILLVAFLLFQPKVSSLLFPLKRQLMWNNFLKDTQETKIINPQKMWQFREFYSPGYFSFDKYGLDRKSVAKSFADLSVPVTGIAKDTTFLEYHSPFVSSLEILTDQTSFNQIVNKVKLSDKEILFQNETSVIYKEDRNVAKIIFLKSIPEMKTAIGYFENNEQDNKLLLDKHWLHISQIRLP